MTAADLDIAFTLTFDRAACSAAEWDFDFIHEAEGAERSMVAIEFTVNDGRVFCAMLFDREDGDGFVTRERDGLDATREDLIDMIKDLDPDAAARIERQGAAVALLNEAGVEPGASNTLADMASEIRSLREMGDAGRLAAALIADRLHEDEREAGFALAGWAR